MNPTDQNRSQTASGAKLPPKPPIPIPPEYTEEKIEKSFWPKLKRVALAVPGISDVLALYFYMNSGVAPIQHKLSVLATLAYFIMPIDLLPDFLGPLGYTDDIYVAYGLIKFIGSDTMKPYRIYSRKWLKGMKPGKPVAPPPKGPIIDTVPVDSTR